MPELPLVEFRQITLPSQTNLSLHRIRDNDRATLLVSTTPHKHMESIHMVISQDLSHCRRCPKDTSLCSKIYLTTTHNLTLLQQVVVYRYHLIFNNRLKIYHLHLTTRHIFPHRLLTCQPLTWSLRTITFPNRTYLRRT